MERLASNPNAMFKDRWPGWGAFLGNGTPLRKYRNPDEWVLVAEKLANENKGELHSNIWLVKNGYSGLSRIMRKHPGLFRHIKQRKPQELNRSPGQWVLVAENLAKSNNGVLNSYRWLRANGFLGLVTAMRIYPRLFDHIIKEKLLKTAVEWVDVAGSHAGKNGGIIPCSSWLVRNGYSGLLKATKKHPELFIDLKQEIRSRKGKLIGYRGGDQAADSRVA